MSGGFGQSGGGGDRKGESGFNGATYAGFAFWSQVKCMIQHQDGASLCTRHSPYAMSNSGQGDASTPMRTITITISHQSCSYMMSFEPGVRREEKKNSAGYDPARNASLRGRKCCICVTCAVGAAGTGGWKLGTCGSATSRRP